MRKLAVGALGAAAFAVMTPAPAQADPIPVDPGIGSGVDTGFLYLEIAPEDGPTERAVLSCPGGQGHSRGEEACLQLTAVDGEIGSLEAADGICNKMFAPVTFKGFGFWDGKFKYYEETFGNQCEGVLATGGTVFDIVES
ncbi:MULTISPECIES: SSI family serine proteinase inhibitor [Glycomyces]|uniref:Subtilisin inhibitor-like n=1 Tax=Glycomyces artemisiae TaxID=1076443 RepID=A0A2T0UHR9_9ACTN|nr:SSI family serine proteinase inhibitor [Glycomyces artemisiae]PRY57452.1 subtilisin inhibitor-like [Glycomyces artemisiae]